MSETELREAALKAAMFYRSSHDDTKRLLELSGGIWHPFEESTDSAHIMARYILATQWQPIETAPKDGTELLVYGGEYHYTPFRRALGALNFQVIASWNSRRKRWCVPGTAHKHAPDDWVTPTHWMSLPEPPKGVR